MLPQDLCASQIKERHSFDHCTWHQKEGNPLGWLLALVLSSLCRCSLSLQGLGTGDPGARHWKGAFSSWLCNPDRWHSWLTGGLCLTALSNQCRKPFLACLIKKWWRLLFWRTILCQLFSEGRILRSHKFPMCMPVISSKAKHWENS